jgi:outer membrane protein insertion porin family
MGQHVCNVMRAVRLLIIFSLFVFTASSVLAQDPSRLKDVKIQGNIRVEEEGIRLHIQARAGDVFDKDVIERDVKAIYRMGFFDDVQAEMSPDGVLTYAIKEKPYIKEVKFLGNSKLAKDKLETAFGISPRTILDRDKVSEGIDKVKKLYSEQGYLNAKIDSHVSEAENNQAIVAVDIDEGTRLLVKKISFQGNKAFPEKELKGLMGTKEEWFLSFFTNRGVLDHDALSNDMAILASHYYDNGYINHKISEPVIVRGREGIEIIFRIEEGEQYKVGKVEIGGDMVDDPKLLLKKMQLTQGQIFRGSRLREDISNLSDLYADKGFAFAQVEPVTNINPKEKNVDIALMITKGPPVYFNRVLVQGNNKTRDKVVRRSIIPAEQELYSSNKVKQSKNALQRTGYFEDVQLSTKKTDQPDAVDLLVDVKEGPTGSFNLGAGYSSGDSFVFNAGVQEKNLFGRGQALNLNANLGSRRQDFVTSFTEPYFLDTPVGMSFDGFNNQRTYADFSVRKIGFDLNGTYPFNRINIPWLGLTGTLNNPDLVYDQPLTYVDYLKGGLGYELLRSQLGNFDTGGKVLDSGTVILDNGRIIHPHDPFADDKAPIWTSSLGPSLAYDSRDHFFHVTEGMNANFLFKFAGLGGDSNYIKTDLAGKYYYPMVKSPTFGTWVLDVGGTVGWGSSFTGGAHDLPLFDRYFAGGINTVRGFTDRSLAPREQRIVCKKVKNGKDEVNDGCPNGFDPHSEDVLVGGSRMAVGNVEMTFPVMEKYGLRGVAFFDMGNAFDTFRFSELRRSVGAGGRWLSPFGPLRVELGFPLNKQKGDDTSVIGFALGGN